MHYVIGCGGVGSHLAPDLLRMLRGQCRGIDITVVDGDTLEEKNLDRQIFPDRYVGWSKAAALADLYSCYDIQEYFHAGITIPPRPDHPSDRLQPKDWLFCCADNHACRRQVLEACDRRRCQAVVAANETTDFEAYYYHTSFKDTANDPRVFHPEILTDTTGDPLGPPGCVRAARRTPQLVLANAQAAQAALWLWLFWSREFRDYPGDTRPDWPVLHQGNPLRVRTVRLGQRLEGNS